MAGLGVLFTYGVLLVALACSVADTWSGQASLLVGYLVLVAPFVMGGVAYQQRRTRQFSRPHRVVFYAATLYLALIAVFLVAAFVWQHYAKA